MRDYQDLADQIDELSRRLPELIKAVNLEPAIRDRLARFVEALAEEDVLEGMGYYSQEGAYEPLCKLLRGKARSDLVKTFKHCGQDHPYHVIQGRVKCPICQTYRFKVNSISTSYGIEDVASAVLDWLGIMPSSIPGWNTESYGWD